MTLVDDYDFLLPLDEPHVDTLGEREAEDSSLDKMTEILSK